MHGRLERKSWQSDYGKVYRHDQKPGVMALSDMTGTNARYIMGFEHV